MIRCKFLPCWDGCLELFMDPLKRQIGRIFLVECCFFFFEGVKLLNKND